MQALLLRRHGGPEALRLETVPDPVPVAGEVLVRVRACALNHLDCFVRRGIPGVTVGLPRILGSDIAGQRVDTGDPVLIAPGIGCGACHACLSGRDNACPDYQILGYQRDGGYAELIVVPHRAILPLPAGLDFHTAAALPLVFLTAWNMLIRQAGLQPGQTVLVWGAGSGVGGAAIQVARLAGARVIATVGDLALRDRVLALGAEAVVVHYDAQRPVARQVKELCPAGVDVVVEHVGQATWAQSLRALAPGGTLVTCGATTGHEAAVDLRFLFSRQLRLLGSYMGRRADLDTILAAAARGQLRPVVDRVMPWTEAPAAHAALEQGGHFGKLVLAVT